MATKQIETFTDPQDDPAVEWVIVDPETAELWLGQNDANRNVRERVVSSYVRDMAADAWQVTGETVKFDHRGNLLDGQHRLHAIIRSGKPQKLLVVSGLNPDTRAVIDTGAIRTGGDALRMAGVDTSNPMALAGAARLWVLWDDDRLQSYGSGMRKDDRATHSEILAAVTARPDLIDATHDSTRDYERIGIPPGPGAMTRVVLQDVHAEDAVKFFDSLAGYATDGANDPRAVLLYTIRQMRALGQLRKPGESIGLTFAAWNAWRDGQKITSLPVRDSKGRPLRIPTPV